MIHSQNITYQDKTTRCEGYYAYDDQKAGKRPAILIAHAWGGRDQFVCQKAEAIATLGYLGFALDIFGEGKRGQTTEEKSALIQPFLKDRQMLARRMLAALETLKTIPQVDPQRIAAMGFCFGGLCVLDLARTGAALKGVISFHGLLNPPTTKAPTPIPAKILALHGYDDPMVPPTEVLNFANEMTQAGADWQIDMYGHTKHAFTNPEANDQSLGTIYNAAAEKRSWRALQDFLTEIFA